MALAAAIIMKINPRFWGTLEAYFTLEIITVVVITAFVTAEEEVSHPLSVHALEVYSRI